MINLVERVSEDELGREFASLSLSLSLDIAAYDM